MPVISATQAPSRGLRSLSQAGVHAPAGIFRIALCMSSVIVIPTE